MQHYVLVFVLSGWRSQGRSVNNDDSKIWLRQFTDDRNAFRQRKTIATIYLCQFDDDREENSVKKWRLKNN